MESTKSSFVDLLFRKRLMVGNLEAIGIMVESLVKEVDRQIKQVSLANGGDPFSGKGVTKSGIED